MAGRGGVLTIVGTVWVFVASGAALAEAPRGYGLPLWACLPNPLSDPAQLHIACMAGVHDTTVSCGLIKVPFPGYVRDMKLGFQNVLFIRQGVSTGILSARKQSGLSSFYTEDTEVQRTG